VPLDETVTVGRRVVLAMLGAGLGGILFGGRAQSALEALTGVSPGSSNLLSLLPAGGRFRIYSVTDTLPALAASDYRLDVTGLVERPLRLTLDDLRSLPATHHKRDFQCVTGWRVRTVSWTGVALSELIDRAGVRPGARGLRFTSFDGTYTESLTLDQARRPDVLVAYEMEGRPLSRIHGGPARLYVAPMYGYKSLKWLRSIEVLDHVEPGYWEREGYDVDAWVGRSNARDGDRPV
jgi:DMSO/TMAO reductase YedYZ molybdopterin-dependent catalytic subunit